MFFSLKRSNIFIFLACVLIVSLSFSIKGSILTSTSVSEQKAALPILMYHHFSKSKADISEYVISPESFEEDLKYITQKGYTTVSIADLQDFIQNNKPLPKKPIMITVDDGYLSFYEYAYPLLKKYNCKAVLSVIGFYTEFYNDFEKRDSRYTHVTYSDIKDMLSSGLIEIANHSYNMHDLKKRHGIKKLKSESEEQYKEILCEDILKTQSLLKNNVNYLPYVYTYPFGYHSSFADDVIKELNFSASFICEERINYIGKNSSLFNLCRFNRAGNTDFKDFFNKIEKKIVF